MTTDTPRVIAVMATAASPKATFAPGTELAKAAVTNNRCAFLTKPR